MSLESRAAAATHPRVTSVWWLTAIGLAAMAVIVVSATWNLWSLRRANDSVVSVQKSATALERDLDVWLAAGNDEAMAMLALGPPPPAGSVSLDAVPTLIAEHRARCPNADLSRAMEVLEDAIRASGTPLLARCRSWKLSSDAAAVQFAGSSERVRSLLLTMKSTVTTAVGRQRIERQIAIRRSDQAPGDAALARAGFGATATIFAVGAVDSDLAEVQLLVEQLVAQPERDRLADIKDNQFAGTLARLRRGVMSQAGPLRASLSGLTAELEHALFGDACSVDEAHQTIVLGSDGLFTACAERLALRGEREACRTALDGVSTVLDHDRADVASAVDRVAAEGSATSQAGIETGWVIIAGVASAAALGFLLQARRIAALIQSQITRIDRAKRSLVAANASLETSAGFVRLLHRAASSTNESASTIAAVTHVLEAVREHGGWPAAHAWLVQNGAAVSTGIWCADEGVNVDALRAASTTMPLAGARALEQAATDAQTRTWTRLADAIGSTRAAAAGAAGLREVLVTPVFGQDGCDVILEFFAATDAAVDRDLLELLPSIARQLAPALDRERARREREATARKLLDLSREAGKAEVATDILHNVGNVLNSVSVSATLVHGRMRASKVESVQRAVGLLREHQRDMGAFFAADPRAPKALEFLDQAAAALLRDRTEVMAELTSMTDHVGHIKHVVSMQQSYAKSCGVIETLRIADIVSDALRIGEASLARHRVAIVRDDAELPPLGFDRQRILQILVNLVTNAKHAVCEAGHDSRSVTVRTTLGEGRNSISITVEDNGVGISPENLPRIFGHKFTTRKNGHGFGLHSAANNAKEMGGSLAVHSDGVGHGARFTLTLPIKDQVPLEVT